MKRFPKLLDRLGIPLPPRIARMSPVSLVILGLFFEGLVFVGFWGGLKDIVLASQPEMILSATLLA